MTRTVTLASGIAQRYLGDDGATVEAFAAGSDGGAIVGRLLGDVPLSDGGRLAGHARRGRFVLLDRDGEFAQAAAGWDDRLEVCLAKARGTTPVGVLVRPDGVVLWTASNTGPDARAALTDALHRWAGVPA